MAALVNVVRLSGHGMSIYMHGMYLGVAEVMVAWWIGVLEPDNLHLHGFAFTAVGSNHV